jgi:hypothetical protein
MRVSLNENASMTTNLPEVPSRADLEPLAVTFKVAGQITGLGQTALWQLAKKKRIRLIHPTGVRRTLIWYQSLKELLSPKPTEKPQPRRRGRPRKRPAAEVSL